MGRRNFRKPFKFNSFSEIFYCGMARLRNTSLGVFIQCQYKNMEQSLFKEHSKFLNFDEIFYCGMIRLRNTNLDVYFIQCQQTWASLSNKNMGQNLFKKYWKFQKFNEILYCGMTRFRKVKLNVFRQYQNTKTILKRKIWDIIVLRSS